MSSFRLVCALLLAAGLAMLPVSASFAMTHVAKAETGMASQGDDCPCCKPVDAQSCLLKCCHVLALAVGEPATTRPNPPCFAMLESAPLAVDPPKPDPPPPRS